MRIVIVSWYPPTAGDSGERVRLQQLSSALADQAEVTVVSVSDDRPRQKYARVVDLRAYSRVPYRYTVGSKTRAALSGACIHDVVIRGRARREVENLIRATNADVIVGNQLPGFCLIPTDLWPRSIFDSHNAEGPRLQQRLAVDNLPLRRFLIGRQVRAATLLERKIATQSLGIWAVSPADESYFADLGANTRLVINGGNPMSTQWSPANRTGPLDLLYVGSLGYKANSDALHWFLDEWMPHMPKKGWRLRVVGSGGSRRLLRRLKRAGVHVMGRIPDLAPAYTQADALIVPMRLGGGSRLKVVEALAHGTPIISTELGVSGLPLLAGEHYLLAQSGKELAQLLTDDVRHRLSVVGANGARLSPTLSWDVAAAAASQHINDRRRETRASIYLSS